MSPPDAPVPPFVVSDVAPLRRVVVNPPSPSDYPINISGGDLTEFLSPPEEAARQHREMERLLEASGAEVLTIEHILDGAIDHARSTGQFETWLRAALPELAHVLETATAATLLARAPEVQFQTDAEGAYRHIIDNRLGWTFTRDAAVMTPAGLVLCNFASPRRRTEGVLMRFAARFSPELRRYPVVCDAVEAGLHLEGGDLQVVDEHTLLLGVGHRTDRRVAPLLAQRLDMDVIAVQLRKTETVQGASKDDPLTAPFLHLDTCLTCVDSRRVVTLPYFFEADVVDRDPFTRFLRGVAPEAPIDQERATAVAAQIGEIGWIRRYEAGSGRDDPAIPKLKLVDYLREEGWQVCYVGGAPPEGDLEHLFRVVLPEHTRQAANIVAVAPGHVLAYEGAPRTKAALEAAEVKVESFAARDLWPWRGGPHCLTLPVERG